jgi:methylthioxylose transferase
MVTTRRPWVGLGVGLLLVTVAFAVPPLADWQVWPRAPRSIVTHQTPPLHGWWQPTLFGPGTVPAIAIALLGWRFGPRLAERLSWPRLLLVSYAVGLAWLLSLALVAGTDGVGGVLGSRYEYLPAARDVTDVPSLLSGYVDRIPRAATDSWPTHVAGHPPGALLFFVLLVRVGLGGSFAAGLVVTVLAATTALAVLTTLRALGAEEAARRAAPFLVLAPAAVFMAVSADAVFGAVAAWGLACLALGARASGARLVAWSALAGLLLGWCVMSSYGLPLLGLLAVAVLVLARSWWPLPVAAAAALAVVLTFAAYGFAWWEAFPVLRERYWDGLAADRPASYWMWGNLAALVVCAGPLLGPGLAMVRRGSDRVVVLLAGAAAASILLADLSRMSKAEVERIWLPFVPWLLLTTALLPERWRRWGLLVQVVWALLLQHLLYTSW